MFNVHLLNETPHGCSHSRVKLSVCKILSMCQANVVASTSFNAMRTFSDEIIYVIFIYDMWLVNEHDNRFVYCVWCKVCGIHPNVYIYIYIQYTQFFNISYHSFHWTLKIYLQSMVVSPRHIPASTCLSFSAFSFFSSFEFLFGCYCCC